MSNEIETNSEPLPGYRLIERIGCGGYGEVWRAIAPGGLTKAIKFVFGTQHEKRATNEMRALEHVRGVRHPFLLSLERIEVVGGRLLVVTELADGSVKDRFDQCRREGLRGIPRDELLGYLRDTADALDFMSRTHSLQHLDIKPENLLILAGHVKVADFGLVKDVRQSQASLVGGMTPLYAAPEVFRGAPSGHSDQYSLAIVYQEMLTATLPFAGNSAAELTLHHLNDEPDLAALTAVDRYSVSRALSKDAEHRYGSCRELVDSLANVGTGQSYRELSAADSGTAQSDSHRPATYVDPVVRETEPADFFEDDQPASWTGSTSQMLVDMPACDCNLVDLPPVDVAANDHRPTPTPTLVLGIGGAAGRVLTHFRRMMGEKWGSAREIPTIQFLHIDTDPQGLSDSSLSEKNAYRPEEVLTLPLHRPQHYRENSQQLLHWLGRRWLYNIPRSLRTEGLRPLGRLALADHARLVGQRIRRALVQALDNESLAKTSGTLGQQCRRDAVRVFVVASISGGTGGGMALDIGYAVRAILQKLGLAHAEVIGLMMHSTSRDGRHSELARVNAYSWLSEFNYFHKKEHPYPGDVSCGLPGHAAGVSAFDHTYLMHLGENLEATEFEQATSTVADFIRLNALSPAAAFFEASRAAGGNEAAESPTAGLRTFGIHQPSVASANNNEELAESVCEQVLASWCATAANDPAQGEQSEDQQNIKRLRLDAAGIAANIRTMIELEMRAAPAEFLSAWLAKHTNAASSIYPLATIDEMFLSRNTPRNDRESRGFLGRETAEIIAPLLDKLREEVRRDVARRIENPMHRLTGARQAIAFLEEHFRRILGELQSVRSAISDQLLQLSAGAAGNPKKSKQAAANAQNLAGSAASEYFQLRLDELTFFGAEHVVAVLEADRKAASDEIVALCREIDLVAAATSRASQSRNTNEDGPDSGPGTSRQDKNCASLDTKLSEVVRKVDARLQREFLEAHGGLAKTVMQGGRVRAQLIAKLYELSRLAVSEACAGSGANGGYAPNGSLDGALALATPMLLEYGGNRRVLALVPGEAASDDAEQMVSRMLGTAVTAVHADDNRLAVCVEADGLSLVHAALEFVERRRDRIEFAERVHSRTDIAWSPLVSTAASNASIVWGTNETRATVEQHAMSKTLVM